MPTKFSILVPTRARPQIFRNLLTSIRLRTKDPERIEVLVAYDLDDLRPETTDPWVRCFGRVRGTNLNHDYYNWLAQFARGENYFVLNDDTIIETQDWDEIAEQEIDRKKPADGIFLGWTCSNPNTKPEGHYCEFPIVSRTAANALGYVMPPQFPGWIADKYIHKVFAAVGRVIDVRVNVLHLRPEDENHFRMMARTRGQRMPDHMLDVAKLKDRIAV